MLTIAIVEDNELQREFTKELLEAYLEEDGLHGTVTAYGDGAAFRAAVRGGEHYDIYLLDIVLPDSNGIELASSLRMIGDDGAIVFLTSTADYAVQSYDVDAAYYLLKPLDKDKFRRVIRTVLNDVLVKKKDEAGLPVITAEGEKILIPEDMVYITVRDRRPVFVMQTANEARQEIYGLALRTSFRKAMTRFLNDNRFAECGSSCIVRLSCVETVEDDCVVMKNGDMIYVSRTAAAALDHILRSQRGG